MTDKPKTFAELRKIDVSEQIEKKNNLSYLSWAYAVDQLLQLDESATWDYPENKYYGETVMVFCTVNAFGKSRTAQLPVMDYKNKAIINPDAFAVNTAMQRCLAKAIALHGIGLYIYAGEDLPEEAPPELMSDETKEILINKIHEYIAIRGIETDAGMSQMGAWVCKQVGVKSLEVMTDTQAAAAIKGLNTLIAKEYEKAAKEEAAKEEAAEPETTEQEGLDFTYPQADAK